MPKCILVVDIYLVTSSRENFLSLEDYLEFSENRRKKPEIDTEASYQNDIFSSKWELPNLRYPWI